MLRCTVLSQGYAIPQGCVYTLVAAPATIPGFKAAYLAYIHALNREHSLAATLLKLLQCWLSYSAMWWLIQLLRVNVAVGLFWRCVLWPVLLGQLWRPRWYITVRAATDFRWSVTAFTVGCHSMRMSTVDWVAAATGWPVLLAQLWRATHGEKVRMGVLLCGAQQPCFCR
jgi:hypothetical protein